MCEAWADTMHNSNKLTTLVLVLPTSARPKKNDKSASVFLSARKCINLATLQLSFKPQELRQCFGNNARGSALSQIRPQYYKLINDIINVTFVPICETKVESLNVLFDSRL